MIIFLNERRLFSMIINRTDACHPYEFDSYSLY